MSARVEAAAKAEWERHGPTWHTVTWATENPDYKEQLRIGAEKALTAADAVMFSDEAVERVAQESWNAIIDGAAPWDELDDFTKRLHTETTRAVIAALKGCEL